MNPSGKTAEGGEALRKKFKKITIVGGSLKGARYGDISEPDIRKAARSYRGDPRFAQLCKQWVAAETVAPDDDAQPSSAGRVAGAQLSSNQTWKAWCYQVACGAGRWAYAKCKGRWFTATSVTCLLLLVISRPAFSRLCGRLVGISIRLAFRRGFYLVTILIDSILDEATYQMEATLLPVPERGSFAVATGRSVVSALFECSAWCILGPTLATCTAACPPSSMMGTSVRWKVWVGWVRILVREHHTKLS